MKIFSKKKYEQLLQKLTDLGLDLEHEKEENDIMATQVNVLRQKLQDEVFTSTKLESNLTDAKKEIKRLKTLLTKNKIEYKKEK